MKTREQNLAIIKEATIAANPSIMELVPGCEFDWSNEKYELVRYVIAQSYSTTDVLSEKTGLSMYAYHKNSSHPEMISFDDPFDYEEGQSFLTFAKILGRPVRLADVLLALEKKTMGKFKTISYAEAMPILEIVMLWEKAKDNSNDQSEETLSFLAGLLSDNK